MAGTFSIMRVTKNLQQGRGCFGDLEAPALSVGSH